MAIDEADRRELWTSLRDVLGEIPADTLMTMLPAHPLPELVTHDDLAANTALLRGEMAELRTELKDQMAELRGELRGETAALRTELEGEMAELRTELRDEMVELRGELRGEMAQLRSDIARQLLTLGLALGSLMVATLGTILTLGFTGAFA